MKRPGKAKRMKVEMLRRQTIIKAIRALEAVLKEDSEGGQPERGDGKVDLSLIVNKVVAKKLEEFDLEEKAREAREKEVADSEEKEKDG
jgi:hypothetical protein